MKKSIIVVFVVLMTSIFFLGCATQKISLTEKTSAGNFLLVSSRKGGIVSSRHLANVTRALNNKAEAELTLAKAELTREFAKNPGKFKGFNLVNNLTVGNSSQDVNNLTKGDISPDDVRAWRKINKARKQK